MSYLGSTKSVLRKTILIGWAVAVVWIYLGNLVNFHMNHIWGKQLIPVEWSTTHGKEKKSGQQIKNDRNSDNVYSGTQFDFTVLEQQVSNIPYYEIILSQFNPVDPTVLSQGSRAISLRGPPSA